MQQKICINLKGIYQSLCQYDFAVYGHDTFLFKDLYEALILLFSQTDVIRQICGCRTFSEFQKLILSYGE